MDIRKVDLVIGREARNRLAATEEKGIAGAFAALETFYYSLNRKDLEVFRQIWMNRELVQLDNPSGGVVRGINPITDLYTGILRGTVQVSMDFFDIVEYSFESCVVFAGREHGEFAKNGKNLWLEIRTSRVFAYDDGRWRQIHHHGSIDQPNLLLSYQKLVRSKSTV